MRKGKFSFSKNNNNEVYKIKCMKNRNSFSLHFQNIDYQDLINKKSKKILIILWRERKKYFLFEFCIIYLLFLHFLSCQYQLIFCIKYIKNHMNEASFGKI